MSEAAGETIRVYWRPGCPYCAPLLRRLRSRGVPFQDVNIWTDPDAAAFVRRHANGNETVPTVAVGDVVMVNPSARTVVEAAERIGAIEPGSAPARSPLRRKR
ncbi:mycoredoxin [soil metagenome]